MLACVLGYPLDCIRADLNGALHLYRVLLPSAPCYVRLLELRILQGLRTVHQRRKKLRLREMTTYVDHKATLFTAYLSAQVIISVPQVLPDSLGDALQQASEATALAIQKGAGRCIVS